MESQQNDSRARERQSTLALCYNVNVRLIVHDRDSKFLTKKLKWTLHRSSKPTQAVVDPWSKYPPDLRRPRTLIDGSPAETCSTSSQTTVETFKNTFSCFSLKKRALV